MDFWTQYSNSQHISRKAYIPNTSKDEVKHLLNYRYKDELDLSEKNHLKFFRSDLSSERIYKIFQTNFPNKFQHENGKKYCSHEEDQEFGRASLKRSIVFDSSVGCCVPLYTRKPGCARMKLDMIGYGEAEYDQNFEKMNRNRTNQLLNQHFSGSSTNLIGQLKDDINHWSSGNKFSRVNKSSVHIENEFYMPERGCSNENDIRSKHSSNKNYNGSHLTFIDGFLTPI
ncbi:hypothetical protein HWI79_3770 [Cryptosporidium felis]|nr:hypothetical protein HWI79_3770 [Cryptosporidium felis]